MVDLIEIDSERAAAGREILKLADELGLGAQAAFWLYNEDAKKWQYHLITPLVDEKGPRWVYARLLKVFAKVRLPPGITPLDIFVMGPAWNVFQQMLHIDDADNPDDLGSALADFELGSFFIKAAHVYRLKTQIDARANYFDIRVRRLLAA
ncbi:hypothetical protein GGE65_004706 [Skermanella aerolata]|uniref:hypothetical protein n=1 Tax=Skermanella aerolata TaxID=393310 RepID=UPI003D21BEF8